MTSAQARPEKRRGGRPKAIEPRSSVSTWIAAKHHDELVQIAERQGVSVSAVVRYAIMTAVVRKT
jgi:hypothetical protein